MAEGVTGSAVNEIKVYKVSTDDGMGGSNHLGYVTGEKEDIIKFFEPKKQTEIYLNEISVKEITPELANETDNLNQEKKTLEERIKEINELLKG
ncbi:hypothetical protein [Chryseobacterium sp.]|uniref:hypothetical protein n=1 Tax=Chryseobacterium sp. TaxID=1871047 RepID=UPI0024E22AD5|nr:hypothetical protein [Chryseobacterium sp.]